MSNTATKVRSYIAMGYTIVLSDSSAKRSTIFNPKIVSVEEENILPDTSQVMKTVSFKKQSNNLKF